MTELQARSRRQERLEALCVAAVRAHCGEAGLHFRGGRLQRARGRLPALAPHLNLAFEADDVRSLRGAADGLGLRLAHSDARLHERLRPQDPAERAVFELLEQFRCEACVPAGMAGARHNLRLRFEAWSLAYLGAGGLETARGLLLFTLAQVARSRLTGDAVHERIEDPLEATRAGLAPLIGIALAGCRRERADQARFAPHALALAAIVGEMLRGDGQAPADAASPAERVPVHLAFGELLDPAEAGDDAPARAGVGLSPSLDAAAGVYRVFTRAYDRQQAAASLVRAEQLQGYREQLDRRLAGLRLRISTLAREWQALLARPHIDGWDGGLEEGRIDGRRLAQLVSSPTERRLFRAEREAPAADAVVSLLIDCSGSMREHIEAVALLVDVLARTLELAGVAVEILGFTTGAWNGGRARRDWLRAGRPPAPGRLNEACHLVFKDADTPWRRARRGIAALLKAELFREGLDGEAVAWAVQRMAGREEARRLLLVVSDGSPMDAATQLANDAHYLDAHLQQVVAGFEARGAEIYGIGVGPDLSASYARSHVLDLSEPVSDAMVRELMAMVQHGGAR